MLTGKKPHEGMEINSLYQTVFDAKKSNRPIFPIPNTDSVLKGILEKGMYLQGEACISPFYFSSL
jgi:hypothetical protein